MIKWFLRKIMIYLASRADDDEIRKELILSYVTRFCKGNKGIDETVNIIIEINKKRELYLSEINKRKANTNGND